MGSISRIAGMTTRRSVHTATLLQNGTVLIAGGYIGGDGNTSTAEVFDPGTNSFAAVAGMAVERSSHTATLLPNGKVLIVGGFNGQYLDTTEIYDPETKRFSKVGRLLSPRSGHVATALKNGKILIAGGVGTGWTFLKSAEIYDPATNRSTAVADMSVPRESHTATVLNDGRVLITGGHRDRRSQMVVYTSTEIFDPETSRFVPSGELTIKRHKHEAVRLSDGRVLILGGSDERDGDGAYNNAEVYSPADRTFAAVKNNMNTSRYKLQGTGILLADGRVLVAGGARRAEVFDPATNSFSYAEGDLESTRLFATATLLSDGSVLITGGYRDGRNISDGAWIYRS
ncbi:MAG: kelch repeat-containing protein [bacterium]|nr:kelch repeat-containing protein [bacterium]